MNKTVLICGGAGYIGSHVVRKLVDESYQIVIIDDLSTGHEESVPEGISFIKGSIGNYQLLNEIFVNYEVEVVIHLCANAYVGESIVNPRKYYSNNISNGLVLLGAMIDHDIKSMIFSSSCMVYGLPERIPIDEVCRIKPINPYGRTKAMFEEIMSDFSQAYGLSYCSLRYFNAAGASLTGGIGEDHDPETHLIPLLLKQALRNKSAENTKDIFTVFGGDYDTPDGTCIRDYIHVEDIAQAHYQAIKYLENGSCSVSVNLSNEKGISVLEILQMCQEITGHKIQYTIGPRRAGDPHELIGSPKKALEILDWRPKFSGIRHIIESAWKWHQTYPEGYKGL